MPRHHGVEGPGTDDFRSMKKFFAYTIIAMAIVRPFAAHAQFDNWLSPGELSRPHSTLKGVSNCTQCHATTKGVPSDKCLVCHTDIKERLEKKKGYHARQEQACSVCHNEHKGPTYDLRGLSRVPFNHDDTGWALTGGHVDVKCESCHKEKRIHSATKKPTNYPTYLGASTKCISCHTNIHQSSDPSFQDCTKCHNTDDWKKQKSKLRFNHNRETEFPLVGAHQKVECFDCHKKKIWAPVAHKSCTNCHADPHNGTLGQNCLGCHTNTSWKLNAAGSGAAAKSSTVVGPGAKGGFDHQRTNFPLTGAHIKVGCQTCHGPKIGKMSNFEQCNGCHNNPHGDQFQKIWSVKKTCTNCHVTENWEASLFSHNRDSRYKIEEKHKQVACQQCHKKEVYRWLQAPPDCATCHSDIHRGQFNKTCSSCHTTKGFEQTSFDHNRDAKFSLLGKHKQVACGTCHEDGQYKGVPTSCNGCHNDFHQNELGNECVRCHATTSFKDIEFDHNRGSRFPLTGAHMKNQCNQCHTNFKYKIKAKDCADCHTDVHDGAFGRECEKCHNTASFKSKRNFHNFGEYTLGGRHDQLECATCHNPKSTVRPEQMQCASCHRDPHMNSFGNRCYTCHSQVSWLPSTFRHQQTGFELSGAHRFTDCDKCHVNRVFGGLPQECIFCHATRFQPPPANPSHPPAPIACDTCHFTFGWRPAR